MPQRAPVPRLARRPTDHRGSADRLQPSPAAYEPSRSHPERVCNPVHQGPYGAQSPIMSEGITGATSSRNRPPTQTPQAGRQDRSAASCDDRGRRNPVVCPSIHPKPSKVMESEMRENHQVFRRVQIQALDREQPVLPMMPGIRERRTHSYVRHGTTSLFAALDVASGFVIGKCYKRHRASEFLDFLKQIDAEVPHSLDIHIIMDNYATHKTALIRSWLARRPHYHVHFTPTSASWINQVERWFAELTRKQLRRGVHTSTKQLEADIRAFIERHNENPKPYRWTKSADEILASVKRFCQTAERTLCSELQIHMTRAASVLTESKAIRRG